MNMLRPIFTVFCALAVSLSSFGMYNEPTDTLNPKKDTIHVVGHAHMDMNWLWTYFETMKMANDNLRQAVAFMKEYPDYKMVQSQAAVFDFVEKVDADLFKEVKKIVKDGRLELVGGMWTEGDANLSSGEAIARSFLLGQRYFNKHFGRMANVGWLPDNFGHISQMPQILKLSGCDYFYFHRTKPHEGTFWWQGSDQSKVLCYGNETYNGNITPHLKDEIAKYDPNKRRIMYIAGLGDHGGGPTRANIDMVHQLDKRADYPAVKFATASDYFARASKEMQGRPTHKGEMQFIFEGCYTTVSEIKSGNRNGENSLYANEFLNVLNWLQGNPYPAKEIRDLWLTQTFNQFHDILPGTSIYEANKEAIAGYSEVYRKSTELKDKAFHSITDKIKFKSDMGQPVVAFNMHPHSKKVVVEATVYSHEEPVTITGDHWGSNYYGNDFRAVRNKKPPVQYGEPFYWGLAYQPDPNLITGGAPSVLVRDGSGKSYPAQIVGSKPTPPGFTSRVQFIVDHMPAGGYKTFYVDMTKPGAQDSVSFKDNTFETDFYKIKINMKTGGITSLLDKKSGKEYVQQGKELNQLRMYLEDQKGLMKSWTINKIKKQENIDKVESVKIIHNGPVRASVQTVKTWGKSRFIEKTHIYKSYPRIEYEMEVHWLETGSDTTESPMLRAHFPLAYDAPKFFNHVPFDVLERPANGKYKGGEVPKYLSSQSDIYGVQPERNDGQEVPAQKWVDVTDGQTGIALLNKSKYGHSYHNGELRLTLMRSAGNPDIYPNLGKFVINYALFPHSGDWKNGVWAEGDEYNVPVLAGEPPSLALGKAGATQPEEKSYFSVTQPNVSITGIKQSEEGNELIVRIVETEGKETTANVKLPVNVKSARRLNMIEMPLKNVSSPAIKGNTLTVRLKPHEIATIGIRP